MPLILRSPLTQGSEALIHHFPHHLLTLHHMERTDFVIRTGYVHFTLRCLQILRPLPGMNVPFPSPTRPMGLRLDANSRSISPGKAFLIPPRTDRHLYYVSQVCILGRPPSQHLPHLIGVTYLPTSVSSQTRASQSVAPGPAVSASLGSLLEMQLLRPRPRPPESGILRVGPSNLCLTSSQREFDAN